MNTDNFVDASTLLINFAPPSLLWTGSNNPQRRFNNVEYNNAFVWSFTTASDQGAGGGVCQLSDVDLKPDSYLFQTNSNDLNEGEIDDFARDGDKIFVLNSEADNGQKIVPIPGIYDWGWEWSSSHSSVADIVPTASFLLDDWMELIRVGDVVNGKTYITSKVLVVVDSLFGALVDTVMAEDTSPAYVFLCDNPWPPIADDGDWHPWIDRVGNCTAGTEPECPDTNFEVFYCRDLGADGTYDDLPTILAGANIRSGSFLDNVSAKELYFLRGQSLNVADLSTSIVVANNAGSVFGESVTVGWVVPAGAHTSNIYWGMSSGSYAESVMVRSDGTNDHDNVECTSANSCNLNGLTNDVNYYINITVTDDSGAESEYFGEEIAIATDQSMPDLIASPINLVGTPLDESVDLSWDSYGDEGVEYRLHYTSNAANALIGVYAQAVDLEDDLGVIVNGLENGTTYYFAIGVVDSGNNEDITDPLELIPFSAPTRLYVTASSTDPQAATLSWNLKEEGVANIRIESTHNASSDFYDIAGYNTSYEVLNLDSGTEFYFNIVSINSNGDESASVRSAEYQTRVIIP